VYATSQIGKPQAPAEREQEDKDIDELSDIPTKQETPGDDPGVSTAP
jgi:hypothetical protein